MKDPKAKEGLWVRMFQAVHLRMQRAFWTPAQSPANPSSRFWPAGANLRE